MLVFGVLFLLAPVWLLSLYGISAGEDAALMSRYFGQAFVFLALAQLMLRNTASEDTRRQFSMAAFIGNLLGVVVALVGMTSGMVNALGWLNVALYLVFALGFGWFALEKKVG